MTRAKRPDPAAVLAQLHAERPAALTGPDPDADAVYALIDDDKVPDPMPGLPLPRGPRDPEVVRTVTARGDDVVAIFGLSLETAETLRQFLDLASTWRDGPSCRQIDPIRHGLRRALED